MTRDLTDEELQALIDHDPDAELTPDQIINAALGK